MTIARLWHTRIDPERAEEYEAFARDISLPMFQAQTGYGGVLMFRDGSECTVLTLWKSVDAVEALDASPIYRSTVERIKAAGFLREPQSVTIADLHLIDIPYSPGLDALLTAGSGLRQAAARAP